MKNFVRQQEFPVGLAFTTVGFREHLRGSPLSFTCKAHASCLLTIHVLGRFLNTWSWNALNFFFCLVLASAVEIMMGVWALSSERLALLMLGESPRRERKG